MSGPDPMGNLDAIRQFAQSQASTTATPGQPVLKTAREKKLWQESLQFEAVFVQQMLSSMHKSVPKSGFLPSGFSEEVQRSMMDQAVAKSASRNDIMGLAPNIYRQLDHLSRPQVPPASGDTLNTNLKPGNEESHHAD